MLEAEALGLQRGFPAVGPEAVLGIEINAYAAELARLTVWIGEIQWMLGNGYSLNDQPILKPLHHIECRDALLTPLSPNPSPTRGEGSLMQEAAWPVADAIVGNPPFLGDKKQLSELGEAYVGTLRQVYAGRVPGGADLVCYWFEKARAQIEAGQAQQAGLVATNSIRGGQNRKVLEHILKTPSPLMGEGGGEGEKLTIFHAWADEPWINEGAAVRVSLVGFGNAPPSPAGGRGAGGEGATLNGQPVAAIHADLTGRSLEIDGGGVDLTQAKRLEENAGVAFIGAMKKGAFDIPGELARSWLLLPNPNGCPNSSVLRPWINGLDVTRRPQDIWIVDFGVDMPEAVAALYEAPFEYIIKHVRPQRGLVRNDLERRRWWLHARPAPDLRQAIEDLPRFIVTARVAKYRLFAWLYPPVVCDGQIVVIARSDDTTFGILHSRFHELWALRLGTSLEDRPRYTPTTCFETFPFPEGLQPNRTTLSPTPLPEGEGLHIAEAARQLNELRENWLNPPDWVDRVPEIVPGYPDRLIPKPQHVAELKQRTLTNLYNQRPAWLIHAHRALDEAVAAAYGWPVDLTEAEILRRLLALNRERSSATLPPAD
jgi:type II restriction/modification system DNA methylase subunit YeeA